MLSKKGFDFIELKFRINKSVTLTLAKTFSKVKTLEKVNTQLFTTSQIHT